MIQQDMLKQKKLGKNGAKTAKKICIVYGGDPNCSQAVLMRLKISIWKNYNCFNRAANSLKKSTEEMTADVLMTVL